MIGRTIGKYRFVSRLGRGGMGTVYKAVDETLDREVAVKVLNPELADSDVMKRFRAEATTLARLSHPDIATIYELFRSDNDLLMVMELVRGETLDQLTARCGPLAPERAAYLLERVLGALEHAHRAGVIHRDLKPANVMVTEMGTVKIMDFGIARVVGAEHMTSDGYMMGTPAYMSPEQVLGQEVDGRADLYSAGVMFYRLLTGALPFKADTAVGMVQKQLTEAPLPLRTHREDLPDWCEAVLQRALAKSPADRYPGAEAFRGAIAEAVGTAPGGRTLSASWLRPSEDDDDALTVKQPTPAGMAKGSGSAPPVLPPTPSGVPPIPADGATLVLKEKTQFPFVASAIVVVVLSAVMAVAVAMRRPAPSAAEPLASKAPNLGIGPLAPAPAPPALTGSSAGDANGAPPSGTASTPAVVAAVAPASDTAAAPESRATATTFVPLIYEARTLKQDGNRWSEREATLLLADNLTLTAENKLLNTVEYSSLKGVHYSHGRQPLWNSPEGPAPAVEVQGGAFGWLRGDRHWITLETNDGGFVVLRVDDLELQKVLIALEERTGQRTNRVSPDRR